VGSLGVTVKYSQQELEHTIHETGSYPEGIEAVAFGIGNNEKRYELLAALEGLEAPFLVHPRAHVSSRASLGRGVVVFPQATVNAGTAHVSPGAVVCGGASVGARAWLGAGATVIHGVTVGADAIVGAGSTVLHDVPRDQTVVGSPARPIVRD
jgi:acetyltransferase-like isoleucine patch superfamily enzyme